MQLIDSSSLNILSRPSPTLARLVLYQEPRSIEVSSSKNFDGENKTMAIQKKSLISGKSAAKKATSTMPQVSANPGMTRTKAPGLTRVNPAKVQGLTRVAPAKVVGVTRVTVNKVMMTRVAAPRVKVNG